jgi:phosphatidylserine/phosphatidylglycerophosphate/cardiolipin synthase-like enzyme
MHISGRRAALAAATALAATVASVAVAVPAHAATTYSACVFSNGSTQPQIYDFINSATTSIDVTMYELEDTTAVNDLIAQENAGVTVRVILDGAHQSQNASAYNKLTAAGVGVVWSSSSFVYTHQKTITVDGAESLIMTGNLTSQYYSTGRDYGVFDADANDVSAVESVFNADYSASSITPSDGDNLLWSPTDSESRLLSVINGATTTLDVEELEFSDSAVVTAITDAASRGVTVRIVLESPSSYSSEISKVEAAGATVMGYSGSTGTYIHAKAIVADYGLSTATVEVGSMNISSNSLSNNRELGVILTDSGVLDTVENQFSSDYSNGTSA